MGEKDTKYIEAAIDVFSRYGMRRATMGDIAEKAGVSRQTLYATYANKEEVLKAAICHAARKTMADIEADWKNCTTIAEKLDVFFEHAILFYFRQIRAMPDYKDLLEDYRGISSEELTQAEANKRDLLAKEFSAFGDNIAKSGTNSRDLADFVMTSATSLKYAAADEAHLKNLLSALRGSVLALVGETASPG
ncbi:MAG: TetR/AcrR family transcriptional regulator [Rhizobiaceae bacterium]